MGHTKITELNVGGIFSGGEEDVLRLMFSKMAWEKEIGEVNHRLH
jgi:hypothetical protein